MVKVIFTADIYGNQWWNLAGKLHRPEGPGFIWADGRQFWYMKNYWYRDNKSFQKAAGITDEEMSFLIIKYGNISIS